MFTCESVCLLGLWRLDSSVSADVSALCAAPVPLNPSELQQQADIRPVNGPMRRFLLSSSWQTTSCPERQECLSAAGENAPRWWAACGLFRAWSRTSGEVLLMIHAPVFWRRILMKLNAEKRFQSVRALNSTHTVTSSGWQTLLQHFSDFKDSVSCAVKLQQFVF